MKNPSLLVVASALSACQPGWLGGGSGNAPPVVSIASPAAGATFAEGDVIQVAVAAVDTDGTIATVELLVAGSLVAAATTAPFPLSWTAAAPGEVQLTARATDDRGNVSQSSPVVVTVVPPGGNFPPSVTITSPAEGSSAPGGEPLVVTVAVSDSDGSVERVELFADGTRIGESQSAPFSFSWDLPRQGTVALTATAHDDGGARGDSAAVTATVLPVANPVSGTLAVNLHFPAYERARGVYLWVETASGTYVDTIEQFFGRGAAEGYPDGSYAVTGSRYANDQPARWRAAVQEPGSGPLVIDGETRASALPASSGSYATATWDCLSMLGSTIPQGSYTVHLELGLDDTGHAQLPVHHYQATLSLGGGDAVTHLAPTDAKLDSATVTFTAR